MTALRYIALLALLVFAAPTLRADLAELGNAPAFRLRNAADEAFGSAQVQGRVWVANLFYTSCDTKCPDQLAWITDLRKRWTGSVELDAVLTLSISTDPDSDRPERLRKYGAANGVDSRRWKLLTGERDRVLSVVDGLGLALDDTRIVLVDRRGRIRGRYDGLSQEGIDRLDRDVRLLLREQRSAEAHPPSTPLPLPASPGVRTPIPRDLLDTGWIADRRQTQMLAAADYPVAHDFRFRHALAESGIRWTHRAVRDATRDHRQSHYNHGSGIATADVDGDGRQDLYLVSQAGPNSLWRNVGEGRFEEITAAAGVALADRIGVAASFADVDNDGDSDLYVTHVRSPNALFLNEGNGRFIDASEASGLDHDGHSSAAVFFDFDRDGLLDLFLSVLGAYTTDEWRRVRQDRLLDPDGTGYRYRVSHKDAYAGHLRQKRSERSLLFRNLGDGRFEEVGERLGLIETAWSAAAGAIDANGDGWPDLYVLNMHGDDEYWENAEGQGFVRRSRGLFPKTPWGSSGIQLFDFDNDGRMDLYVTDVRSDLLVELGPDREKEKISTNASTETYLRTGGRSILGNAFFRQREDGGFVEVSDRIGAENHWPWGASAGDLNADGWVDLFVTTSMNFPHRYQTNSVLLNDRGRRFLDAEFALGVEPRPKGRTATPWFSLDCSEADRRHRYCRGRSGLVTIWGALGSRSSAVLDLDGDGDLDIVTNDFNSAPQLLLSDLAQRRMVRYLEIDLVGTASNRDGTGARVVVRSGPRSWTRVAGGPSGYLSQSSRPLYFGLGTASTVDSIEIAWPSGIRQVVEGPVGINGLLTITERDPNSAD